MNDDCTCPLFYNKYQGTCFTMYTNGGLVFNFTFDKDGPNAPEIVKVFRIKLKEIGIDYDENKKYPAIKVAEYVFEIDKIIEVIKDLMI